MKKARQVALFGVLVGVLGLGVLNLLAYNHARAMMRFTTGGTRSSRPEELSFWPKVKILLFGVNMPRPTCDRPPSDLDPDCKAFSIAGRNGVTLACWYCDRGENTPLVLLFHGYSTDKTALLQEARAFLDLGASVLLTDFRGSGGSSESYTTIGVHEASDVAAIAGYVQEHLSHSKTILFGQSMGAVAILKAVHQRDISPDAVILEAVFDSMLNTVRNRFITMRIPTFPGAELLVLWGGAQWGFDGFRHNPVDYAVSLDCPALFMHGTDDPRAKLGEGLRVFNAVPGAKAFKSFEGAGHGSYIATHASEWRTAVEAFMTSVISLE